MLLRNPDANTEHGSSPAQDANNAAPSSAQEDQNQQQAPVEDKPGQENERTIAQVAKQAFDESMARNEPETQAPAEEGSDVQSLDKTQEEEEQPALQPGEEGQHGQEQQQEQNKQKDEELPFHNHPRWKEVMGERNEFERQVQENKPLIEAQQATANFCQQYNISPEQFQNALRFMALKNTNPAEARKALEPILKELEPYDANVLPPDLQARVDAQEMTEAVAKELAGLRVGQNAHAATQKFAANRSQQEQVAQITGAINTWEQAKAKADPDFVPVAQGQVDGLHEDVSRRLTSLWTQNPPKSPQAAVALCEKAYSDSKKFFAARLPKPKPSKVLNGSRSSVSPREADPADAKTTRELVQQSAARVAREHGINWTPPA